jgi:hypothetical protein
VNVLLTFYFGLERPITTARRIKATRKIFLDPDQEIQFLPLAASALVKPMNRLDIIGKRYCPKSLTLACGL